MNIVNKKISLNLNIDEAMVLFEWVVKYNQMTKNMNDKALEDKGINHNSEMKILWDLESCLETVLEQPFNENYKDLLNQARISIEEK